MRTVLAVAACCLLLGCSSGGVQFQSSRPHPALSGIKKICLQLDVVSGSESVRFINAGAASGTVAGVAGESNSMSGKEHASLIAKDVVFQLGSIGFMVVPEKAHADALASFSIGAVRFTGGQWVADQGFLEFRDPKSEEPICSFRADTGAQPMSVKGIVSGIARRARKEK